MKATLRKRLEKLEVKAARANSAPGHHSANPPSEQGAIAMSSIDKIRLAVARMANGTPRASASESRQAIAEITRRVHEMAKYKKPAPDPQGPG